MIAILTIISHKKWINECNETNDCNTDHYFRHLQYIGTAEMGDKSRHTLVRSCVDVGVSDTIVQFLNEMGFK